MLDILFATKHLSLDQLDTKEELRLSLLVLESLEEEVLGRDRHSRG